MQRFTEIPDAQAITVSKGVYRQVSLFQRGSNVYARHGSGFVKLHQGQSTSNPNVRWVELDPGDGFVREHQGSICFDNVERIAAQ